MFNDDLFNDNALEQKNSFLNEKKKQSGKDGLYRVDLTKVTPENKKRGYKAVIRFLPNITKNPEYVKAYLGDKWTEESTTALGPSAIHKISHYLKLNDMEELRGWYDCPTNVNYLTGKPFSTDKYGPFAMTTFKLKESKDAIALSRAEMIQFSNKYFSYILVIEDEQQPELVGKIMVLSYGKQIKDKIDSEHLGEITGEKCNVFNLKSGKDFILLVKAKEIRKDELVPFYTSSIFRSDVSTISLPTKGGMKNMPIDEDGNFLAKYKEKMYDFLLKRDIEVESFSGKDWDERTRERAYQAIDYLTGKFSARNNAKNEPEVEDFSFEELNAETKVKKPVNENKAESDVTVIKPSKKEDSGDDFDFDFDDMDD